MIPGYVQQIASRVEVFIAPPEAATDGSDPPAAATWRRLGFLSLDPNSQSGHQVNNDRLQMKSKQ